MRRIKRSTKQILIVVLIGLFVIGSGSLVAYLLNTKKIENEYSMKIIKLESEITNNKRYVYSAKNEIESGDILTMENLVFKEEYCSLNTSENITEDDIGKRMLVKVKPGQAIYKNMLEPELEYGLRELEYNLFRFNTNIKENDTVDIRLVLPNGTNFIVLKKKLLKNVDLESCKCNLWLNEEEILRLSSAIVDAASYESAYLVTARYIDSGQEESVVTYQPSEDVMLLIANDPNIVENAAVKLNLRERKELEERLGKTIENQLSSKKETEEITDDSSEESSTKDNIKSPYSE